MVSIILCMEIFIDEFRGHYFLPLTLKSGCLFAFNIGIFICINSSIIPADNF